MNKRLATVFSVVTFLSISLLAGCQGEDEHFETNDKPEGYVEPIPVKLVEEEPITAS
ncbi:hypothetical protein J26TS2_09300 [Shouchella clausii]|uniref:hypothetical protein n=1 Tax=Shouchella tritolerans TaxID=2979466 RepID=UPI000AFCD45C|nr:hypothetical protein [Shouchella tritolerans]GIN11063.1 hypothetical protein J26TS2_09300 [Shouchella clausii]